MSLWLHSDSTNLSPMCVKNIHFSPESVSFRLFFISALLLGSPTATHDPVDANLQKLTQLVNKESNLIEKVLARSAHSLLNLMSLEITVHGQKYVDAQTVFPVYIETCMLVFSPIWSFINKSISDVRHKY